jgi:hypothetical protein
MDDVTALPILLIIHCERDRRGCCKDGCFAIQREQRLALPKPDVAEAELNSARRAVFRGKGVFPYPEQEIER